MVDIYISYDKETHVVDGFGYKEYGVITKDPKDSVLISVKKDHPVLLGDLNYKYESGKLIKANDIELENLKEAKIEEFSNRCHESILDGFEYKVNDQVYRFNYNEEAQINLSERWQLFQNNMIESIKVTARDYNNDPVRLEFDKIGFTKLYLESVKHKEYYISKFRDDLCPMVKDATSKSDLDLIQWEMEIIYPSPKPIVVKDDKIISSELKRVELDNARGISEAMMVMYMMSAGRI